MSGNVNSKGVGGRILCFADRLLIRATMSHFAPDFAAALFYRHRSSISTHHFLVI
jgi:hypothetical protein